MRYVMLLFTSLLISACTPRFIETPFPPQAAATQATQPLHQPVEHVHGRPGVRERAVVGSGRGVERARE